MQTGQEATTQAMTDERQVLIQAEALADQERWKEAAMLLEEYQSTTALSLETLGKLADYRSHARDYDGAIAIYRDLCQQQPDEKNWFYRLGFQYQQKEQWTESIEAYSECLRIAPRSIGAALKLGDAYRKIQQNEKALNAYRQGIQSFQGYSLEYQHRMKPIYAKLCARTARILLEKPSAQPNVINEAIKFLQASVAACPDDTDVWYRLGGALLDVNRLDQAFECLQKAQVLNPKKEYISHKIAQVLLRQGKLEQAIGVYEKIPSYRRTPYILRGLGQCLMAKGESLEAAKRFHQAIQKEPGKFHYYWDLALALISLEAKDQAIEALERANELFREAHGNEYGKALKKLEEVRSALPDGKKISFEESSTNIAEIRHGTVLKYDERRGFGFIEDENGGARTFFHITKVKKRTPPRVGQEVKYVRETGEKGLQAINVWLLNNRKSGPVLQENRKNHD